MLNLFIDDNNQIVQLTRQQCSICNVLYFLVAELKLNQYNQVGYGCCSHLQKNLNYTQNSFANTKKFQDIYRAEQIEVDVKESICCNGNWFMDNLE